MRDAMAYGVLVFGALVISLLGAASIAQQNDGALMTAILAAILAYLTQFVGWLHESGYRGWLLQVSWTLRLGAIISSLLSFFTLFGA